MYQQDVFDGCTVVAETLPNDMAGNVICRKDLAARRPCLKELMVLKSQWRNQKSGESNVAASAPAVIKSGRRIGSVLPDALS